MTGNTLYTLTGLEPQMYYGLTMKAMCDTCKKETPWSELLYFYSGVDTTSGIEGGETLLSRMTFLQPNPARDEVLVTSSFNLLSVDIWTVDGVMVHHQAVSGHDVTVDAVGHLFGSHPHPRRHHPQAAADSALNIVFEAWFLSPVESFFCTGGKSFVILHRFL